MRRLHVILAALAMLIAGVGASELISERASGSAGPTINGDVDCSGAVSIGDAIKIARYLVSLPNNQPSGCPPIGGGGNPTTPAQHGLTRDDPVPFGESLVVPEGWEIEVVDFIPNATQLVLDENQFNDPPEPGFKFAIVRVRMKNISAGNPADPQATFAMRLVGSRNVGYTTFTQSCGVIPDHFVFLPDEIFSGGEIEGNVCFSVGTDEANFTLYTDFSSSADANIRWFDIP